MFGLTPLPDSSPPPARAATAWWLSYGVLVVLILALGLSAALQFNGEPIDGPFQLYNALRRINAGQRGGVDFQFFHGLAIPYLHYPLFRLFGGGFTGSEMARQVITTLSGPIALLVFFRAYLGDWDRGVKWAAVVLSLSVLLRLWPLVLTVNSLLALRSAVALSVPIVWVLQIDQRRRAILSGLALGAALLLGTEQGLAVIVAYVLVSGILAFKNRDRESWFEMGIALATMVLVVLAFLIAVGGWTGATRALRYNLTLVPMDQYWYFGAPPNPFIGSWGRLLPSLMSSPPICLALIIGGVTAYFVGRGAAATPANRRRTGIALLAVYGLISCASLLGIFLVSYVEPLIRVALLAGALRLAEWIERPRDVVVAWHRYLKPGPIMVGACLLIPLTDFKIVREVGGSMATIADHGARGRGMELSDTWRETIRTGQRIIDANLTNSGRAPALWSTYAGLLEAQNGIFHPSTDYIIHVLGPTARDAYVEDFRTAAPVLAQTVLPSRTPYETWIELTSWDFYDDVIRHYRVTGNTEWSIFWRRTTDSVAAPHEFWSGKPDAERRVAFRAPAAADSGLRLVEVTVHYQARNAMRRLPIVGSMPRYLVLSGGAVTNPAVTLDPYVSVSHFPLVVRPGAPVLLVFQILSLLPGATLDVDSVSAASYAPAQSYRPWLINLACAGQFDSVPECR